ncbi:MAG: YifB family Mg chelatase-like AAA ATPase [Granulosicoccus sp.]
MSYSTVHSCTLSGVQALAVTVEVHTSGGLPGMSIVGLPQSAVRESKDRVKAAIQHIGLKYPQVKIIVNLAPADLPKRGGRFDLPIALGILQATDQIPAGALDDLVVLGELGLTGQLRSVTGVLPAAYAFAHSDFSLFIPAVNAEEALRSACTQVHCAENLFEAVQRLRMRSSVPLHLSGKELSAMPATGTSQCSPSHASSVDMADVLGQHQARRALEIAAAGSHNLLMIGPPGTGKSMLACRLPTIQPAMSEREAMEAASVASISHAGFDASSWGVRPFRAPHHTASGVALVGGGAHPMPGEISLAHNGVLFLDELPEFSRTVLDVLREPMETGQITVSRAARQAEFPSRFQLVAAMNPCPCGYFNDPSIPCRCGVDQIVRYQARLSGPFLDRIDLHIELHREVYADGALDKKQSGETSAEIRARVVNARELQILRQNKTNSDLDISQIRNHAMPDSEGRQLLQRASDALNLSLRAQHRLIRTARTIADLDASEVICEAHISESLSYRPMTMINSL